MICQSSASFKTRQAVKTKKIVLYIDEKKILP